MQFPTLLATALAALAGVAVSIGAEGRKRERKKEEDRRGDMQLLPTQPALAGGCGAGARGSDAPGNPLVR